MSAACGINLKAGTAPAQLCGQPAAYTAWLADCAGCHAFTDDGCTGHPVCTGHGAALRTTALTDCDRPARLARLHAITRLPLPGERSPELVGAGREPGDLYGPADE